MSKPIRIFWSPLSNRFYASNKYQLRGNGNVVITGEKYDVTDQIANLIDENGIVFEKKSDAMIKESEKEPK